MADVARRNGHTPTAEASTAELVRRASEQASRLIRDELALARAELTEKGKRAGLGAGLLGGGGVLAFYGFGALVAAAVLALALVLPGWAAALIVAAALFVLGGLFALVGKVQITRAIPPVPTAAARSLRADMDSVKAAVKDRGRP